MILPFDSAEIAPYLPTVIDIETATNGDLLDVGMCSNERYLSFTSWEEWLLQCEWDIMNASGKEEKIRLSTIYAHNGARFDWLHFIRWGLDTGRLKDVKVIMSEQLIIGSHITTDNNIKITLCDSLRLMPFALKDIASKLNKDHQKLYTGDYITHMQDFRSEKPEEYYAYLKEDCLALQEALYRFWCKIYDLEGNIGRLPMTLPALALRIFRKYIKEPISTPWNEDVKAFTRRAYTGGRVECYRPGIYTDVEVYDVNSMYPYCMATFPVPISARGRWVSEYNPNELAFWEISYDQEDNTIPPLLRDEKTNRFLYVGNGVYHTSEINQARSLGVRLTMHRGYAFSDTAILFREFVGRYYRIRQDAKTAGDLALDFIAKILLNSLYGKFGQRPIRQTLELATNRKIYEYVRKGKKITMHNEFMLIEEEAHVEHEFVAIAATITSQARVVLFRHILSAGDQYIYSDTDSVHVEPSDIAISDGLGGLKLEYSGEGVYIGKKMYAIKSGTIEKIKAKGIGRAVKAGLLTFQNFVDIADGTTDSLLIEFEAMPSVREVLYGGKKAAQNVKRSRKIRKTS